MKNKPIDLNNHLFAQIERLSDEDLIKDSAKLNHEIARSQAMAKLAGGVIQNNKIALDAAKAKLEAYGGDFEMPEALAQKKNIVPPAKLPLKNV